MKPRFDGKTYNETLDRGRLETQLETVKRLVMDGRWRSLREISQITGYGEASISARIRDFRKSKFGAFNVERRRHELIPGLFEYRLTAQKMKELF